MEATDKLKLEMDYPAPDTYRVRLMVEGELSTSKTPVWYDVATLAVAGSQETARFLASHTLRDLAGRCRTLEPPTP